MKFPVEQLIFLILTMLGHIAMALFFAKPRFNKLVTAMVWVLFGAMIIFLPTKRLTLNFLITLDVHFYLFFVTTRGRSHEKCFLFLSYACIYTCTSALYSIVNVRLRALPVKIIFAVALVALMQLLLYAVLLRAFRRVAPYIRSGWARFYAVVLGFFVLILVETVIPTISPLNGKEILVFLLTVLAFCITYLAMFDGMKNVVELSREKRKQIHSELLLSQVQAQAQETEIIRRNCHDMRHHYQQLLAYAANGDLDNITEYLKYQTGCIENLGGIRFCENETVNNILRVYRRKAMEQGIDIRITAAAKPDLSPAVPDLVAIIANILENALHGAAQSGSEAPYIDIKISHKSQRFVISCENSCISSLNFDEMPVAQWGIGIQSIAATADRYGGSYRFCAKDGVFSCTVIMDE